MNLLYLAPDIQEAILFLPPARSRRYVITERHFRAVTPVSAWRLQRCRWRTIRHEINAIDSEEDVIKGRQLRTAGRLRAPLRSDIPLTDGIPSGGMSRKESRR